MCRFPLRIKNKGYKVNDLTSPMYVDVSCGHCEECKSSRISEYLYRATYEHDSCLRKGGFACFLTLTFNRESLNIVECSNGFKCSTWNNNLLTKFKNRLQKYFIRRGYTYKYICTCERGKNGTKRPHYHLILFVIPLEPTISIDSTDVACACACAWSFKPRNNVAIDLSMRFAPFTPNTRYVAKNSPCGYIFNEAISRTDHEAIKYVVKYCVKDSAELCNNLMDIKSSTFPISQIDMVPRTTQSNGIGISFFDKLPDLRISETYNGNRVKRTFDIDIFKLEENAQTLLNYRTLASDGTPINIPRYYIKKLCQRPIINARFPVADDTTFFNGKMYAPKFFHEKPIPILVNRKQHDDIGLTSHPDITYIQNYRIVTRSTLDKSLFSVYLNNASLSDLTQRLWDCLCSLRTYQFNFIHNIHNPTLQLISPYYTKQVLSILHDIDLSPLFLLGYDKFHILYCKYYHSPHSKSEDIELLSKYLSLVSFSKVYNSVINTQLNTKKYVENMLNMVEKRPLLFVDRLEND